MSLVRVIKTYLYFWVAAYFKFWASIYLLRWKPTIIAVIGSSGKTTLLHLFEAELGDKAAYSHNANSAFGIPFNILGLERKNFRLYEWFVFFILSPFQTLRPVRKEKIYVVEADAERPGEGRFSAKLLRPNIVVWLSLEEAHGVNFDKVSKKISRKDLRDGVRKAIAYEFGYFVQYAKSYVVMNTNNNYIDEQKSRTITKNIVSVSKDEIILFSVGLSDVTIETKSGTFIIPQLVPRDVGLSVLSVIKTLNVLNLPVDPKFSRFELPPGRSSVFKGKRNTTIIDSTYNATYDGMRAMLDLIFEYPSLGEKWLIIGDMIEQGRSEPEQHRDLANLILNTKPDRVVFVGPRLAEYTYPIVVKILGEKRAVSYNMPADALAYLEKEIKGGETILFKGARYLEGVVEKWLENSQDASKLCRRNLVWIKRREQWGI